MANEKSKLIRQLSNGFLTAIKEKDIQKIKSLDNKTEELLYNSSLDRRKYNDELSELKKAHNKALDFVYREAETMKEIQKNLIDNQEGLRGYYEVMNQE